jgi:beta-lysine N6-acetyltransferase
MRDTAEGRKMGDKIERIGESVIQHGKFNNRIYLLKLNDSDVDQLLLKLNRLAYDKGYTKVFGKIRPEAFPAFLADGYVVEAYVPGFFDGSGDCMMVSKFFDEKRSLPPRQELEFFGKILNRSDNNTDNRVDEGKEYNVIRLDRSEAGEIASVFKKVFLTYPFPVHDPDYITETMITGKARYFGIRDKGKLIGVSTAEIDMTAKNVEMTDFAVLPDYRGNGLAYHLLLFMEKEMKNAGIKTAYTIARLKELGMNKTFIKAGYKYAGTLVNNTNIGGSIESMNIFYNHV